MPQKTERIKRGRKPGREFPLTIQVMVSVDEDEYVARKAESLTISKSRYMRICALPDNWLSDLVNLRELQKHVSRPFRRSYP